MNNNSSYATLVGVLFYLAIISAFAVGVIYIAKRIWHPNQTSTTKEQEQVRPVNQRSQTPTPPRRQAPGSFDPTTSDFGQASSSSTPRRSAYPKSVVRLTCQHLEEVIGDPKTLIGTRMLCRTCGAQQVETVIS